MNPKSKIGKRVRLLLILMIFVMTLYLAKLVDLQIIHADKYSAQGEGDYSRRVVIKAARGEILDRYGRPIAINRTGYNVVFNKAYMKDNRINENIVQLINSFTAAGVDWNDDMPLAPGDNPRFSDDEDAVAKMKKQLKLNHYATARDCYDTMVSRYGLQELNGDMRRLVMGVRYTMESLDFSVSNPFTFAEDIPSDLMLRINEASVNLLSGIEVRVVPVRVYPEGTLAPHLIGSVVKMTAEDWEEKKAKGYSYDDKIGKGGIEEAYEEYLHGVDGETLYQFDRNGNLINSEVTKEPVQGNTVILTIDSGLQRLTQTALETTFKKFNGEGSQITGASAVVMNVNNGQVLTAANYPSYDLNTYSRDIAALTADTAGTPLMNRAFCGAYQPGSTFKPATAIAALTNNAIGVNDIIRCTGVYRYFEDYPHKCHAVHGNVNMVKAISRSCNYYFYEVGRRTGIGKLNETCKKLGLGEKTGVEVDEKAGILAGPEYTKSINEPWYEGNTIQAAIGQSYNMFTPLQLANYTATVANGGTRYKATIIKRVTDYTLTDDVIDCSPKVEVNTGFSADIIKVVKEGMLSVTEEGTARAYFSNYPIRVGGKTGTAQNQGPDHSLFIAFAPFENSEIALAVIFEHGESSQTTGTVAKQILDHYFYHSFESSSPEPADTLLP